MSWMWVARAGGLERDAHAKLTSAGQWAKSWGPQGTNRRLGDSSCVGARQASAGVTEKITRRRVQLMERMRRRRKREP